MKKLFTVFLLSLGLVLPYTPALAQFYPGYEGPPPGYSPAMERAMRSCDTRGGNVDICISQALHRGPHAVPARNYASGGTYILHNAKCIAPGATFGFHSAHRFGMAVDPSELAYQNNRQRQMLNKGNLVPYLDSVGAFESTQLTTLSAEQVSRLTGIPLCR